MSRGGRGTRRTKRLDDALAHIGEDVVAPVAGTVTDDLGSNEGEHLSPAEFLGEANYPVHAGPHWTVLGEPSPSRDMLVSHLNKAHFDTMTSMGMGNGHHRLGDWSLEELLSLHDDVHAKEKADGKEGADIGAPEFGNVFDLDNYTDPVESVACDIADATRTVFLSIEDAGHLIGGILKAVSSVIAFYPGIGTALSVAIYAAGAAAAHDKLDEAAIGTVSVAMPAGLPRTAFDGGAKIVDDVANGRNIFPTVADIGRNVAIQSGGKPAGAAYDTGLAIGRGQNVTQQVIADGRAQVLQMGPGPTAAYDAAVAIGQGQTADTVMMTIARDYISQTGGNAALIAFDSAVALAYGKTLQEAGFAGLRAFVRGSDAGDQILRFVDAVGNARSIGVGIQDALESDLVQDFTAAMIRQGQKLDTPSINAYLDKAKAAIAQLPPGMVDATSDMIVAKLEELGTDIDEAAIRAVMAITRNGAVDSDLIRKIYPPVTSIGRGDTAPAANAILAAQGVALQANDHNLRNIRKQLSWGVQQQTNDAWRHGFDVGTAVSMGHTLAGPGQDAVLKTLQDISMTNGFLAARYWIYGLDPMGKAKIVAPAIATLNKYGLTPERIEEINSYATRGAAMALNNLTIAAAINGNPSATFRQGFYVATAFCQGNSLPGPGQDKMKADIMSMHGLVYTGAIDAGNGFDVGQAVQFGITRTSAANTPVSTDPNVAAGQLVVHGIAGQPNISPDQKAAVVGAVVANNPAAAAGASGVLASLKGFFSRLLALIGL